MVNTFEKDEIANILFGLGEERRSRAIAAAIVKDREKAPFERTGQLAGLVERVLGHKPGDPKHPATRTFQALRLYVNDELGELERALARGRAHLEAGRAARRGQLPFARRPHCEDAFWLNARASGRGLAPSARRAGRAPRLRFELKDRHGVEPSEAEIAANPRARSARLRWAIRTDAPAPSAS